MSASLSTSKSKTKESPLKILNLRKVYHPRFMDYSQERREVPNWDILQTRYLPIKRTFVTGLGTQLPLNKMTKRVRKKVKRFMDLILSRVELLS